MAKKKKPSLQSIQRKFQNSSSVLVQLTPEEHYFLTRKIQWYGWLENLVYVLVILLMVAVLFLLKPQGMTSYTFNTWHGGFYESMSHSGESSECARLRLHEQLRQEYGPYTSIQVELAQDLKEMESASKERELQNTLERLRDVELPRGPVNR